MPTQQKYLVLKQQVSSKTRLPTQNTSLLLELDGAQRRSPQNADNSPLHSPALWFIFLWRSIDFLLFSLPLIPGSVSSVALYRGAIIQGLITAPLAAYLLPGDSLFKPLPNDLGKLTCSTSQGCGAPLMSEGVAPTQGLLVLPKKKRGTERSCQSRQRITHSRFPHICCRLRLLVQVTKPSPACRTTPQRD